jgi:hypothetical protein
MSLLLIITSAFVQTDLTFDRSNFVIRWKILGCRYWQQRGRNSEIQAVDILSALQTISRSNSFWGEHGRWRYQTPKNYFNSDEGIALRIGHHIVTTNSMSGTEKAWLIAEIRDWLALPQKVPVHKPLHS